MESNKKNALIVSSHIVDCKRVGGFHKILDFLENEGYSVDWITTPMHIGWLVKRNDRENVQNFFKLWKGYKTQNGTFNFALPMLIPGKVAKKIGMSKIALKAPDWLRVKKRLHNNYDVIVVESVGVLYAANLKYEYPLARIIYRPSDTLKSLTHDENANELEIQMIDTADITLCVDENMLEYYKKIGANEKKLAILRNPLSTFQDIEFLKSYTPQCGLEKSVVYVGVSFYDRELVENAASRNKDAIFYIIGPFEYSSHDNVCYLGSLKKNDFEKYLLNATVGIAPIIQPEKDVLYGYTGKIISYMKYLLPVVATNSSNYLNVDGFYICHEADEFARRIRACLDMTNDERLRLKNGYLSVLTKFELNQCKKVLMNYININLTEAQK